MLKLERELEDVHYDQFGFEPDDGVYTGKITINDLQISWNAELNGIDTVCRGKYI